MFYKTSVPIITLSALFSCKNNGIVSLDYAKWKIVFDSNLNTSGVGWRKNKFEAWTVP